MRIALATLGCKINQYESDLLRQDLLARGNSIVSFDDEADVYIINTCTVTSKSDIQSRQLIRSAVRRGREARVVVTGCYAETRPEEVGSLEGVDLVIGNSGKPTIPSKLALFFSAPWSDSPSSDRSVPLKAVQNRTRAFLKIQDGCDNCCSYCIVPSARGRSRSAMPNLVMSEFDKLIQQGCREIVLTGIHLGTYGMDLHEPTTVTDLIASLLTRSASSRVRLSSIEPKEITDKLISLLGNGLCRHLHIPLQSGNDGILALMKRNYTADYYRNLLKNIAERVPDAALGADVMVGFPGEGEEEFLNTASLVERSPLTYLHVFSYSPRPGTAAAAMKYQVPDTIKKKRNGILRDLGREKNLKFRQKFIGSTADIVIEDKIQSSSGLLSGLTDNYIRVSIKGASTVHIGHRIQVRIDEIVKGEIFATFP